MSSYVSRMRVYFREMFPLPRHFTLAAMMYGGLAGFARYTHDQDTSVWSLYVLLGIWSSFSLLLILRLMDEIKDEDIDRELFPERPLPSKRVSRSDIGLALSLAIATYLGANAWAGWVFWIALAVVAYSFLMFRRFYAPELLRRSLPVTLATHTPIIPLMILHGFCIFAAEHSLKVRELYWDKIGLFTVMLWSLFLSWELARKVRAPEEETQYVTYSLLLGPRIAAAAVVAVQTLGLGVALYFFTTLSLSWVYLGVAGSGLLLSLWVGVRFISSPTKGTARVKWASEINLFCVLSAQLIEFVPQVL